MGGWPCDEYGGRYWVRARGELVTGSMFSGYSNCYLHGCPCGYYGDPVKECTCSNSTIQRYQKRISGPLLDRIDIHVEVPRVEYEKLADNRLGETSAATRTRVEAARARQRERFKVVDGVSCNA